MSIIPNPFDKTTNITDVSKKTEVLKQLSSLYSLFISPLVILFVSGISIFSFKIPFTILFFFGIGVVLLTVVLILIKLFHIKILTGLESESTAQYKEFLIKSELWNLVEAIVMLTGSTIGFLLAVVLFGNTIQNNFIDKLPVEGMIKSQTLLYTVIGVLAVIIFQIAISITRYVRIKNISETQDFASLNQQYVVIEKQIEVFQFIPLLIVALVLFMIKVPLIIVVSFFSFVVLFIVLSVVELNNIKKVNTSNTPVPEEIIKPIPDEMVIGGVYGILKTASGFKDIFKPTSVSILGAGKNNFPENALYVTNNRLLFSIIPMTGGNTVMNSLDFSTQNFLFNRGEMIKKGKAIENDIAEVLKISVTEIPFTEIKSIKVSSFNVRINTFNNGAFSYNFLDKENSTILLEIIGKVLSDKIVK